MPDLTPYLLQFSGGLHIGTRGVNLEEAGVSVPADTLFAALLDALRRAGENLDDFIEAYNNSDPPFLLTSAFPYAGDVRFYPMPADPSRLFSPATITRFGKRLGRIRYLSEGLLTEALSKGRLDEWLFPEQDDEIPQKGVTLQGHSLWLKVDEIKRLPKGYQREERRRHALPRLNVWGTARVQRVTIDRISSASNIFQAGKVEFADGCGLWFGVQWRKPEANYNRGNFKDVFDKALHMLSEDGLGGERTTGYGAFKYTPGQKVALKGSKPGELAYLLSRYHPRPDEVQTTLVEPRVAYQMVAVGGWLRTFDGAAQRRKRVFLVESGSLIRSGEGLMGDLVDVRPEYEDAPKFPHPVFRYGLALTLGWPSQGGGHA